MALLVNSKVKQALLAGPGQKFNGTSFIFYFYPATVPMPSVAQSTVGFIGQVAVGVGNLVQTGNQIKLSTIVNFTPTITGTVAYTIGGSGVNSLGFMMTDSVVPNGSIGMVVLSTTNFVAGQQVTLLDFTLNLS